MTHAVFNPPPGWPCPPAGWVPDANWRPDPSWPPVPHGWQLWVQDTTPVQQTQWPAQWEMQPSSPPWQGQPRSKAARIWLTIAIVLGPMALIFVAVVALLAAIQPANYATYAEYDQAVTDVTGMVQGLVAVTYFVAYASLAPKVSFRWFDAFFLLIPIYGWVFQFRIAYRLVYLPHKDWAPRPDELARGQLHTNHGVVVSTFGAPPRRTYGGS